MNHKQSKMSDSGRMRCSKKGSKISWGTINANILRTGGLSYPKISD